MGFIFGNMPNLNIADTGIWPYLYNIHLKSIHNMGFADVNINTAIFKVLTADSMIQLKLPTSTTMSLATITNTPASLEQPKVEENFTWPTWILNWYSESKEVHLTYIF